MKISKIFDPLFYNKYVNMIFMEFFKQADASGPKKLPKMWVNFRC